MYPGENKRKGFRDAIHVPYVLVTCHTSLTPGQKVSLREGNECVAYRPGEDAMWHGVADPFEHQIEANQLFTKSVGSQMRIQNRVSRLFECSSLDARCVTTTVR